MKLTLKLRYHTRPGQSLWVSGEHPALGGGSPANCIPLQWADEEHWQATIEFPPSDERPTGKVAYHYVLKQPDGSTHPDWAPGHSLSPALFSEADVLIVDSWNDMGRAENAFYTKAFREVLLRENETAFVRVLPTRFTHTFRVRASNLRKGQVLGLLGNTKAFGDWDTTKPVLLDRHAATEEMTASVDLAEAVLPVEYKYAVFNLKQNAFVGYEGGRNRVLNAQPRPRQRVIVDDGFADLPSPTWKGAGVAVPVFSLRSENSFGVGEFNDLKLLADWGQQAGLKLIQILPINDTTSTHTWKDSYPYSAISAFALNPIYVNLAGVVSARNKGLLQELEPERNRLNSMAELDYPAAMSAKLGFLKRIFPSQKAATFRRQAYKAFFAATEHWLRPYAAFSVLRDKHGTADSNRWPAHQRCTPETVAAVTEEGSPDFDLVAWHYFIQFHLHTQLQEAAAYAHARGIILMGDIPIGVSRDGADTWQEPELYNLGMQTGAPPDPFAQDGQNWGFPTYNWARMTQKGFAWWKQRFTQMDAYFDAMRIDHILGFFRIWSIPTHALEGVLGYFVPAIPVEIQEFSERGIPFNRARLTSPFITDAILEGIFGAAAEEVRQLFLERQPAGGYALLPAFATQRQVEQHFSARETTAENQKLMRGLFDLISNVVLLEVPGSQGRQFHFRFHMEKTESFRFLDERTQALMRELYIDYFFRRQDVMWRREGLQKLPALQRETGMLLCGEDLGLVPACVPKVMRELGLPGFEVQRMPKMQGRAFSRPADASYLSVVTPSTHDMSTVRNWWVEDPALTQRFYNEELGRPGPAPADCTGEMNEAVVRQHLASPAMWSIFQLQDLLGMDETLRRANPEEERINIPSESGHNWRYRMHLTLESLLQAKEFKQRVRDLIQQYSRG
jgi:4-alpha-glucanotransferase